MTRTFERLAGYCAVLAALASVVFTVAFAVVVQEGERWAQWVSWITLLAGGLVTVPVMVALYALLGHREPQVALVGVVLGVAAALGAAIHGAFELALLANPVPGARQELPSEVDPRGFMTFAVTGLALLVFGWLVLRTGGLDRPAGGVAVAGGALVVVVYLGRLTALDPKNPVTKVAALASGLVLVPGFYLLVARGLLRRFPVVPPAEGSVA